MHTRLRIALVAAALFLVSLGKDVMVSVSGGGFGPSNNRANVGDVIKISFTVGTASFTQSSLDKPCVLQPGGLDSGIITIPSGQGPQQYTFTLQNTAPLFFFNSVTQPTNMCRNGFIGTINATPQQIQQFLINAKSPNGSIFSGGSPGLPLLPSSFLNPAPVSTSSASIVNLLSPSSTVVETSTLPSVSSGQSSSLFPSLPSSLSSSTGTRASDTGGTTSVSSPPPTSTAPSIPFPSPPTTTAGIPGHTPQPVPSASGNFGHNNIKSTMIIGIVLGMATLLASAFAFIVIKRHRNRGTLLPQTHHTYPQNDGSGNFIPAGRVTQLLRRALLRLASVRFRWRWGWNRLEEKDKRRVTPYLAQINPPVVDIKARGSHAPPARERPPSEATLVLSVRGSEASDHSDASDMSLVVNVSSSEKGEGCSGHTPSRIGLEKYPFVLPTTSGNARLQRQFPSSSTSDVSR